MIRTYWVLLFASCLTGSLAGAAAPAGASDPSRSNGCQQPRLQAGYYTEVNWPIPQTNVNHQTIGRTFVVYVPPRHEQPQVLALPIVIAFHGTDTGAWGQGAGAIKTARLQEASGKHGFVVVAPNAWPWSTWTTVQQDVINRRGFSDVEFVRKLLDILDDKLCIDRNRVFATGGSNGGFMSAALARAGAEGGLGTHRIAAVAPVAAFPQPKELQLNTFISDEIGSDPFRAHFPPARALRGEMAMGCEPPQVSIRPANEAIPMHVFYGNEDRLIANSACFGSYLRSLQLPNPVDRPCQLGRFVIHLALCGCNGVIPCVHGSGIEGNVQIMVRAAQELVQLWAIENGCAADQPSPVQTGKSGWGVPLYTVTHKCSGVPNSRADTMLTIFDVRDSPPEHPNNPEIPTGHIWPGGVGNESSFSVTEEMWQFFNNHPR
jgi:poly(3-hydroxybutyrate) depolymerase